MYGHGATWSSCGANRPTASAPAVAPSAVRHHASHVRSAAMEVRRSWSRSDGETSPVSGCSESSCGCVIAASNTVGPEDGAAPESNRPSRGLHDRTGFEDQLGHRAHAAPPTSLAAPEL